MAEVAVNVPLDANEIKSIACEELRKRLDQLGPLQGGKEYARFDLSFQVNIRLYRTGETTAPKDTLAWGHVAAGEIDPDQPEERVDLVNSGFTSGDPNAERQARGMPLTVETTDGRGGKTRKKVNVQGDSVVKEWRKEGI